VQFVMNSRWTDPSYAFTSRDVFTTISSLRWYLAKGIDAHPYREKMSSVLLENHSYAYFPLSEAQRMAYEVFGWENWRADSYPTEDYREDRGGYLIPMEAGLWTSAFTCENLRVTVSGDQVQVRCVLKNSSYYEAEDEKEYGEHEFLYRWLGEEELSLRLLSVRKVDGNILSQGPFVGYVADRETPWIELYTEKNGTYVGRIPYEIFHDWIATDRNSEGWTPGWDREYLRYYYAEFGDFRWAAVHLGTTVLSVGRKNIATSSDGGKTWRFGSTGDMYGGNHVVGIGFASEKVAFMSYDPYNEFDGADGPVISRTTDSGKTWELLEIPIPEILENRKLISGVPFYDGELYRYPVWVYPGHGTKVGEAMYLISRDGGITWEWEMDSVKVGETKYTVEIPLSDQRDYVTVAGVYGKGEVIQYFPAGNIIEAGSDGTLYYVMGVGNAWWSSGNFKSLHTYRVTSKNGYIESVEEVETLTKDKVLKNGTPYTGELDGLFRCSAYRFVQGNFDYDFLGHSIYIHPDGTMEASAGLIGTGGPITYEGTYQYDRKTGSFTAKLIGRTASNGEIMIRPEAEVTGKLYEYGGFVHFVCEKSGISSLTLKDPLPLTFVPNTDGYADPPTVVLPDTFSGNWETTDKNYPYRVSFNTETAQMQFEDTASGIRYTGSYTVNALTMKNTAVLRSLSSAAKPAEFTLKFYLNYSHSQEGMFVMLDVLDCSAPYQHLVGKMIVFQPMKTPSAAEEITAQGAFLGYLADENTQWIDLYTGKNGTYVGRVPRTLCEIFNDVNFVDKNFRESWKGFTPGWLSAEGVYDLDYYYGRIGMFYWCIAVFQPGDMSGRFYGYAAVSSDGGQNWISKNWLDGSGTVINAGFISESTAFVNRNIGGGMYSALPFMVSFDGGESWGRSVLVLNEQSEYFEYSDCSPGVPYMENSRVIYPVRLTTKTGAEKQARLVWSREKSAWEIIAETNAEEKEPLIVENESVRQYQSVLAGNTPIYLGETKQEMVLGDYLEIGISVADVDFSVEKYALLDMDDDSDPEMVLWIRAGANEYYGFLVLHREEDTVAAYGFPYRGLNSLKEDGTFYYSGGVANDGIGRIAFTGTSCTVHSLAYRESADNQNVFYSVGGKSVSRKEYIAYENTQSGKPDAVWVNYAEY